MEYYIKIFCIHFNKIMLNIIFTEDELTERFENLSLNGPHSLFWPEKMKTFYRTEKYGPIPHKHLLVKILMSSKEYERSLHDEIGERNTRERMKAMLKMYVNIGCPDMVNSCSRNAAKQNMFKSMKDATKNMTVNLKTGEIEGCLVKKKKKKKKRKRRKRKTR